jgi:hypothetical protein
LPNRVTAAGTWQVRNIQAANAITYSLKVSVNAGTPAGTVISHTASVSNDILDRAPENNSVTTQTTVGGFNSPPTLAGLESAPLSFAEGDPPTPVTATLTISDANDSPITGATVAITGNYSAGQDVLAFAGAPGIAGNFDPVSGILTLSGTSALGNYQAALRAVTYRNTGVFPVSLPRTVRFQVSDDAVTNNLSNVLTRTITFAAFDEIAHAFSIEFKSPEAPVLTFRGIPGRLYTIEFSGTLERDDWHPLATIQTDAQGSFGFLDEPPPGTVRRFYGARRP